MDENLLKILVCPETKEPVTLLDDLRLRQLNALIQQGKLINRQGKLVTELLQYGLVRTDEKVLYPVRRDIPVMLIDEAILLDQLS